MELALKKILLREVQQSICANPRNLMKFADVLKLMTAAVAIQRIAREIKESYCELTNFVFLL